MARALTGALTGREVARAVFDHALSDLGVSTAGLWMIEGGVIRHVGGAGMADQLPGQVTSMPLDGPYPAAVAIATGRPVAYGSRGERDLRWPSLSEVETRAEAVAVLPLLARNRVLGALHIGYSRAMAADELDLAFLGRLAELCAAALDRAALHDAEQARQAFLLDVSAAVAGAGGLAETLHRLAAAAVPRLADLCFIDVAASPQPVRRMAALHADPAAAPMVEELLERYPPSPGGGHPAIRAVTERRSFLAERLTDEYLRAEATDERHYQLMKALGYRSFVTVPLLSGHESLGAVTLISAGSGRTLGPAELALAEEMAARVAGVVAAAQRRDREHELAHVLQRMLLPVSIPEVAGVEIEARYLTAVTEAEAGGDFYDVVMLPSRRVGFVIGDVEGHDAMAAATMGQLRSALRVLAGQHREPGLLLDALRWSWELLGFSRMATCLVGRLDPVTGDVVMASAGHLPPVLIPAAGPAATTTVDISPPLGVPAGPTRELHLTLKPGETLFLYTDGLVEVRHEPIDTALNHLCSSLGGCRELSLGDLCDRIVGGHADPADRPDDVALLALRLGPQPPGGAERPSADSGES